MLNGSAAVLVRRLAMAVLLLCTLQVADGRPVHAVSEAGWSIDVASPLAWHPIGTVRREGLIVATRTGFTVFDPSNGSRRWRYIRDDMVLADWTYSGEWIVADYIRPGASAPLHTLLGLEAATGEPRWQRADLAAAGSWQGDLRSRGPHAVLAWSSAATRLLSIDSATGRTVWSRLGTHGCEPSISGHVDAAALVVERCAESIEFSASNPDTGRAAWTRRIPGRPAASLVLARGVAGIVADGTITVYDASGRRIASRGDCTLGCSLVRAGKQAIVSYRVGAENVIEAIGLTDGRSQWRQTRRITGSSVTYRELAVGGGFVYGIRAGGTSPAVLDVVELATGRADGITLPARGVPVVYGDAVYVEQTIDRPGETTTAHITRIGGVLDGDGAGEALDDGGSYWPGQCAVLRPDVLSVSPLKRSINGLMVPFPNDCFFRDVGGATLGAEVTGVASTEREAATVLEDLAASGSWRPVRGLADQALANVGSPRTLIVRIGRTIVSFRSDRSRPDRGLQVFAEEAADTVVSLEPSVLEPLPPRTAVDTPTGIEGAKITVYEASDDPVRLIGYVPGDGFLRVRASPDGKVAKMRGWAAVSPDSRMVATTSDSYPAKGRDPVTLTDLVTGQVRKVLTVPAPRTAYSPQWSKDGSKILFTVRQMHGKKERTSGFVVVDMSSLTAREVTLNDPDAWYVWGGDDTTIARRTKDAIVRYRTDGTRLNRLPKTVAQMWDEDWLSPSGTRFAMWCPDDDSEICIRDVRDGSPLARVPYDAPGLVAWYDEYHLIVWRHDQSRAPHRAVVVDMHGRVIKTIAEVGKAEYEGGLRLIFRPRPSAEAMASAPR